MENVTSWQPKPDTGHGGTPLERGERLYRDVFLVLETYIYPAVCALGCLGNLLNLAVLNKGVFRRADGGKETSAHIALTFLALCDMMFCVCLFPRCLLTSHESLFPARSFLLYYQVYGTGFITTFLFISTWIIVAMATMRYLAICYPLKARLVDGPYCAKILFPGVCVTCSLLNLPSFWIYRITTVHFGDTYYLVDIGYMDYNSPRGLAFLWFKMLMGTLIPAFMLIYCNSSLIRALQRSYRMRRQFHVNQASTSSRNRVTLMLVAIVTTFVLLVFPSELMDFFILVIKEDYHKTEKFLLFRSIANFLQVINFAFNFVLYCVVNIQFRYAARDLVTCNNKPPRPTSSLSSMRAAQNQPTSRFIVSKYACIGKEHNSQV